MTVHYQNQKGEETMISGVIHLQNVDDHVFSALMENGSELTLRTSGIEAIYHEDTKTRKIERENE